MRAAVTGSSGLIGSALLRRLEAEGHEVVRLVRGEPGGPGRVGWDPGAGRLAPSSLEGVDVVFHLAGAGIGDRRWSPAYKELLRSSRIAGTATVARAVAALAPSPALVSVSAIGFYGSDPGERRLTEDSPAGSDFLARLCVDWEAAAAPAREAGARVVHPRLGLVLSAAGGVMGRVLPLFRLGLGGRVGSGRQMMSWITREDAVAALLRLATDASFSGPVNVTAPEPVTNAAFSAALGRALHRPAVVPVPAAALRLAFGREMADETVLAGQCAVPALLEAAHHAFRHPDIAAGIGAALADRRR